MGRNGETIALPVAGWRAQAASIGAVAFFAAITGLAGQVRVPLPFTPVPITLQLMPVLLAGAFLGPARGAASQALLIAAGAAGAPVFAGGAFGLAHLLGPTGGYLLGFPVAAWLTGAGARRLRSGSGTIQAAGGMTAAMIGGAAAVHLMGLLHLTLFFGGSPALAFQLGSAPFLAGDLIKAIAAASIAAGWGAWISRRMLAE